ncbi:MAG: hypothetical protein RLY16_2042 [Bacteroidota bacterium]|jgi:GNAT superfamily N-acetyltransferase
MEIKLYEDWMRPQVDKLFSDQYSRPIEETSLMMQQFYEHPFQKNKSLRLVALDGDIVIGFQSFFYWPYLRNGVIHNTCQSGNSLVHPNYRGKGIFQKLLNAIEVICKEQQVELVMGFPVEMSYPSFMKMGWSNPFNLIWYLKMVNPLAFLFDQQRLDQQFEKAARPIKQSFFQNMFRLNRDEAFEDWIHTTRKMNDYRYFTFSKGDSQINFVVKFNKRNKWINELVIGDIKTNSFDETFIKAAFKQLKSKAFWSCCISILTIAINENESGPFLRVIQKLGYNKSKWKIYFITKTMAETTFDFNQVNQWLLFRSDIDTW